MIINQCVWTVLLLGLWFTDDIFSFPPNTAIDCQSPHDYLYPNIDEGYSGTLEQIKTPLEEGLSLDSPSCPICLSFLNLSHSPGDKFATVNTKKPLDIEALTENNGALTYFIVCTNTGVSNMRTLPLNDMNDNGPIFEKHVYSIRVSESLAVDSLVVQVKATDADVSPVYNSITYSWGSQNPASDTFELTSDGSILLKTKLNYPSFYSFTVTAKDIGGNSNTTTVMVKVYGGPYFEHEIYNAMIPENKIGPFQTITPAPIKAYGEDAENNQVIIYKISSVSPSDYSGNFIIESTTGVITVQKELDHEKTSIINLVVQASLENDREQTANTMVIVEVKDVNEPPVFIHEGYIIYIDHVVSEGSTFVVVKARDPDVGDVLLYSLVDSSSNYDVDSYTGLIYAVAAVYGGKETLTVKATDPHGLYNTTTVEVTVDIDTNNVVRIVINKPVDTVMDQVKETEKALQKALGLKVKIIGVTSSSSGDVLVSFMATDTTGSVVTSDNLKTDLRNNKEKVLAELQGVFGPDTDFIIEESGPNKTLAIFLLILIPLGCIVGIVGIVGSLAAVWYQYKRHKKPTSTEERETGGNGPSREEPAETGMKRRESNSSMNYKPMF